MLTHCGQWLGKLLIPKTNLSVARVATVTLLFLHRNLCTEGSRSFPFLPVFSAGNSGGVCAEGDVSIRTSHVSRGFTLRRLFCCLPLSLKRNATEQRHERVWRQWAVDWASLIAAFTVLQWVSVYFALFFSCLRFRARSWDGNWLKLSLKTRASFLVLDQQRELLSWLYWDWGSILERHGETAGK